MATLWASASSGELWYSLDNGDTWTEVDLTSLPSDNISEPWGPTNVWKIYAGVDGAGIYYYDGTWNLEYNLSDYYPVRYYRPENSVAWCNEDDTLVTVTNSSYAEILTRDGAPGSSWSSEYSDSNYYNIPRHVHGTGQYAYAVFQDQNGATGYEAWLARRNPSTGVWQEVARVDLSGGVTYLEFNVVRVVSDTEVWIGGDVIDGGVVRGRIWKWNGSTLSTEYSHSMAGGTSRGLYGLWMADDGSEGWAVSQDSSDYYTYYHRYNGTSWSLDQTCDLANVPQSIAQIKGDTTTAISVHNFYGAYNKYDGADWQNVYYYDYDTGDPPGSSFRSIWYSSSAVPTSIEYFDVEPPGPAVTPYFTTSTDTSEGAILKGRDGEIIEVYQHTSLGQFTGINAVNDNYIVAIGGYLDGSGEQGKIAYYKNGKWEENPRISTITDGQQYHSIYPISDGYLLLAGTSTSDGEGVWRYFEEPAPTKVLITANPVIAISGDGADNIVVMDDQTNVYQCTDSAGTSWLSLGQIASEDGYDISVVGSEVFAAINSGIAIYDGSWSSLGSPGMNGRAIHAIATDDVVAAGLDTGTSEWKIKTWDGATWTDGYSTPEAEITAINAIKKNGNIIYCVGEISGFPWGVVSEDAGSTWTEITWPSGYEAVTDIYLAETTTPSLRNLSPVPGQGIHLTGSSFEFEIVDPNGIDPSSVTIDLTINGDGYSVWASDVEQSSFNVAKTVVDDGYKYVVSPPGRWPTGTRMDVEVYAEDNLDNILDTTYWFKTATALLRGAIPYYANAGFTIEKFDGNALDLYNPWKQFSWGEFAQRPEFIRFTNDGYAGCFVDGHRFAIKYGNNWTILDRSVLPGYTSGETFGGCWTHPSGEYSLISGRDSGGKAAVWKIDSIDLTVTKVLSTSFSEVCEVHGNSDASLIIVIVYGNYIDSGVGFYEHVPTYHSFDGGNSFSLITPNAIRHNGAFTRGLDIWVRDDGIAYAGVVSPYGGGRVAFRYESGSWAPLPNLPGYHCEEIYSTDDNNVWVRLGNGTNYYYNGQEWQYEGSLSTYSWRERHGTGFNEVIQNGYRYDYVVFPTILWDGYNRTSIIYNGNNAPFQMEATQPFDFIYADLAAPSLSNQSPAANSRDNSLNSIISVNITDADSGVDVSTVEITVTVDGTPETAWVNDAQGAFYTASKSATSFGYFYTLSRNYDYVYNGSVVVEVYAEDIDGNVLDTSWTWHTKNTDPLIAVGLSSTGNDIDGYEVVHRRFTNIASGQYGGTAYWDTDTLDGYSLGELHGVWASAHNDIWSVGEPGPGESSPTVIHYNGNIWESITIPGASGILRHVFGLGSDSVYVCGDSGIVYYWDGNTWNDISNGSEDWRGIYATATNNVFVVSHTYNGLDGYDIDKYDGSSWSTVHTSNQPLNCIHGYGGSRINVGGDNGRIVVSKNSGSSWGNETSNTAENINDVYVFSSNGAFVAANTHARYWNTDYNYWSTRVSPGIGTLRGVWGHTYSFTYVVDHVGRIFGYISGSFYGIERSMGGRLNDIWGIAPDSDGPAISAVDPTENQISVAIDTNIQIDITDTTGLNEPSVTITIDEGPGAVIAWQNDSPQSGFSGSKSPITNGYRYTINPDGDLAAGKIINVSVSANDLNSNTENLNYSFTTSGPPIVINKDPLPGATSVSIDKVITFDVEDGDGDLDVSSIVITVDSYDAYNGATGFGSLFDAASSGSGDTTTFSFSLDYENPYPGYTIIPITVYAEDTEGGILNDSSWFFTTEDIEAPIIQNLDPFDGKLISAGHSVYIELTDTQSGINPNSVDITIDGDLVWTNGTQQAGYLVSDSIDGDVYSYSVNKDGAFWPENQTIPVNVKATDNDGNYLVDSDGYDYSFDTTGEGPFYANLNPANDEEDVSKNTTIEFDLYDIGDGLDRDSVIIKIDTILTPSYVTIWQNRSNQSPNYSTDDTTPTTIDGYAGYHYVITPSDDLPSGDIYVNIIAKDLAVDPDELNLIYRFSIEGNPPELRNQDPAANATQVAYNSNISFAIVEIDEGDQIVVSSVDAYVGGVLVFDGQAEADGYGGFIEGYDVGSSFTPTSVDGYDGYAIVINGPDFSSYELVSVRVLAQDSTGNTLDETYSFRVQDYIEPIILNRYPDGDGYSRFTSSITYDVVDPGGSSGININSLDAYVGGSVALAFQTFYPPFDGGSSSITPVTVDGYDGYHIILNYTDQPWPSYEIIEMHVHGYDFENNGFHEQWTFRIEDYSLPTVLEQDPSPSETGVVNNIIELFIGDRGTGVAPANINIDIKSLPAVVSGSIVSPFNGPDAYNSVTIYDGYIGTFYRLDYTGDWTSYELINIDIDAYDFSGNHLDTSYSFRSADTEEPVFGDYGPAGGDPRNKNTLISANFYDKGSGVDFSSIKVYINSTEVYDGTTGFTVDYSGPNSGIASTTIDGYDGYKLTIDKVTPYTSNQTVGVRFVVPDNEDN